MTLNYSKIKEMYFPIIGYENYSVSNFGNVKNIKTGRILSLMTAVTGYLCVNLYNFEENKKAQFNIHRLVAAAFLPNPQNKRCVDHINGDKTNNKLENLRYATVQQNAMNRKINTNNTSGTKGVTFNKRDSKWCASIKINGKLRSLGYFLEIEDAIEARKSKAVELFGEYMHICEL